MRSRPGAERKIGRKKQGDQKQPEGPQEIFEQGMLGVRAGEEEISVGDGKILR